MQAEGKASQKDGSVQRTPAGRPASQDLQGRTRQRAAALLEQQGRRKQATKAPPENAGPDGSSLVEPISLCQQAVVG